MDILKQIERYEPYNVQEAADKEVILAQLRERQDIFCRSSAAAHMTASAWVANKSRDKVLMVYHNIYDSWSWMGGHADGEKDLLAVARREVCEESGLSEITPLTVDIFSLEVLTVDGHEKNGQYVPSHLHLNVTFLFEADENAPIRIKADENSGVA